MISIKSFPLYSEGHDENMQIQYATCYSRDNYYAVQK